MSSADDLKEKLELAINASSAEGLVGNMPDFIAADDAFRHHGRSRQGREGA